MSYPNLSQPTPSPQAAQSIQSPQPYSQPLSQPLSQSLSQSWEAVEPDATESPQSRSLVLSQHRKSQPRSLYGLELEPSQPANRRSMREVETEQEIADRYARTGIKRAPNLNNRLRLKALVDRINHRQWNMLPDGIHPTLTYNGQSTTLYDYTQLLKHEFPPKSNITLEIVSAVGGRIRNGDNQQDTPDYDGGGGPVGARLRVKTIVIDGAGIPMASSHRTRFEYSRHIFVYFTDGKISEISDITDEAEKARAVHRITPAPCLRPPPPRISIDLAQFYRAYIDAINSTKGDGSEVYQFCRPAGVVWNGVHKPVDEYCRLTGDAFDAIPDLKLTPHTVLVDEDRQQLAVRIDFTGTPVKPFGGAVPNGKAVAFSEHAFYWLEQGRISDVLTIVNLENYRAQLMY